MKDFDGFLKQVFGKGNKHLKVILIFYNNDKGYFNNIGGVGKILGVSHVTARNAINDLIDIEVLKKIPIGSTSVLQLNEKSLYAKAIFHFFSEIQNINKDKQEMEIVSKKINPIEIKASSIKEVICPVCGSEMTHAHSGWFRCPKCGYSDDAPDGVSVLGTYKAGVEELNY